MSRHHKEVQMTTRTTTTKPAATLTIETVPSQYGHPEPSIRIDLGAGASYRAVNAAMHLVAAVGVDRLLACELLLSVRLLHILGYWGGEAMSVIGSDVEAAALELVEKDHATLVPLINRALRMTHL